VDEEETGALNVNKSFPKLFEKSESLSHYTTKFHWLQWDAPNSPPKVKTAHSLSTITTAI